MRVDAPLRLVVDEVVEEGFCDVEAGGGGGGGATGGGPSMAVGGSFETGVVADFVGVELGVERW